MPILTGGEALIHSLVREGIRTVFGIPGQGQYEAVDAFFDLADSIRYISLRHEQAASYMADGYARASGEIAAVLVVQGPGVLNATAGMATAYAVSSPMLVITGPNHLERRRAAQQAGEQATPWLSALTKWSGRAVSVSQTPGLVHEAMRQMRTGRPRPVALEVPHAVLAARQEVELCTAEDYPPAAADASLVERAAEALRSAKRPLIWAGGGAQSASAEITALAERLQAAVATSRSGKGVLSDRHPLALGFAETRYAPLRRWIEGRDLILAVGTSADFSRFDCPVVQVDIDPDQISAGSHVIGLVGDARRTVKDLLAACADFVPDRSGVAEEIASLKVERFDPKRQLQPQWDLMCAVRAALPDDAILVQGMNQMGYYSRNYYPAYAPRSYLTSSSLATLGAAFPLALGAQIAQPQRRVVALCGDGGFLYNAQELATAVQNHIPAITVVFNDNAYGNVLRAQMEQFGGRVIGTQLHNPEFTQLARLFGAVGVMAQDARDLAAALRQAVVESPKSGLPTVIEVPVGPMQREF